MTPPRIPGLRPLRRPMASSLLLPTVVGAAALWALWRVGGALLARVLLVGELQAPLQERLGSVAADEIDAALGAVFLPEAAP